MAAIVGKRRSDAGEADPAATSVGPVTDTSPQDLVQLPVGTDVGTIEVILARLQGDGIPATVEPDLSSLSALDEEGFRLMVRAEDVAAVVPVLQAAGIDTAA
jgi:hypothetical protein